MSESDVVRIAGLLRVSTVSVEQSESPEAQLLFIREEVRKHSQGSEIWIDTGLAYEDELTGAIVLDRPGVKRLIADAKAGKFDVLAMKSIQRLGRDTLGLLHLKRILDDYGIELMALQDSYRSRRDPELIFLVHADRAQAGREDISRNVRNAVRQRAKQGKWMAGTVAFGYRRKNRHELEFHPETAPIAGEIFRLRRRGWGGNRIAGYLNGSHIPAPAWWEAKGRLANLEQRAATDERYAEGLEKCRRLIDKRPTWTTGALRVILSNTAYYGELQYYRRFWRVKIGGRKVMEDRPPEEWIVVPCPPLISREEWDEAQEVIRRKTKNHDRDKPGYVYLLSGLLRCGICGGPMNGGGSTIKGDFYGYYRCQAKRDRHTCAQRSVRAAVLEDALLRMLPGALRAIPGRSIERQAAVPNNVIRLQQLETLAADLADQKRYYRDEHRRKRLNDEDLDTELARITAEEKPLKSELQNARVQAQLPDQLKRNRERRLELAEQLAQWGRSPTEKDRQRLKHFVQLALDRMVFRSLDEFDIHLHFSGF